jgi:hypothetical protein
MDQRKQHAPENEVKVARKKAKEAACQERRKISAESKQGMVMDQNWPYYYILEK